MRFDLLVGPARKIVLVTFEGGFILRLAEKEGRWRSVTSKIEVSREELAEYERATRSAGAFVREWRFGEVLLKWEWQILRVVLAGETWGEGNRSEWEGAVRRMLLG